MRSRLWWVMSIIRGIDTRNNVTYTSWKGILQSQPSSRVYFSSGSSLIIIQPYMFSLWPPSQIVLQRLQPLSVEKISSRARPRAVVLISSEPRIIIIFYYFMQISGENGACHAIARSSVSLKNKRLLPIYSQARQ